MNKLLYFFLITLLVLSCSRCKEEDCTDSTNPDCPNYVAPVDPCAGKTEVSADFKIEMDIGIGDDEWYETNECLSVHNDVRITARWENATSYKWILGVDTFYTQEHIFAVPAIYDGQSLPIKLIVSGTPQSTCFPNDDGVDTVLKYIQVRNLCDAEIWGNYRGAWDSAPTDSFDIRLARSACYNPDGYTFQIGNIDQLGDSCFNAIFQYANKYVRFSTGSNSCSSARGFALLDESGENIYIEYQLRDPNIPPGNIHLWPYYYFRGRKLS